jgi:hypothetical protein
MNPCGEYESGGTFGMRAFAFRKRHYTSGTRYIIACFVYVDEECRREQLPFLLDELARLPTCVGAKGRFSVGPAGPAEFSLPFGWWSVEWGRFVPFDSFAARHGDVLKDIKTAGGEGTGL